SRAELADALKQGGRATTAGGRWLRRGLVVVEVTLSVALLIALTLLVRSLTNLLHVNPGFDPQQVLVAELSLPASTYDKDEKAQAFFGQLLERVRALPAVKRVGLVDALPLNGGLSGKLVVADRLAATSNGELTTEKRIVSPDYFATLGIPIVS